MMKINIMEKKICPVKTKKRLIPYKIKIRFNKSVKKKAIRKRMNKF